jgi:hypothetical protein
MTLQQTVSVILKKEVTLEEAKDFAANQFGVLTAFIEKMKEPKEMRVYVMSADYDFDFDISGYEIENWVGYQEQHNKLPSNAEKFIEVCENNGTVYSMYGFHQAFNIEESIGTNDYVFITNFY